jgi:lysozyme
MDEITFKAAQQLYRDEGWRPYAYRDHLGFLTLGYGFLIDERKGGRIPQPVADFWLRWEIEDRRRQLRDRLPWFENQPEQVQVALINMAYQLGVPGLMNFRRMLAALSRGDRVAAAEEALDSQWARQTPQRAARVAADIRG